MTPGQPTSLPTLLGGERLWITIEVLKIPASNFTNWILKHG
jgi:hypothetical protein